jgi:hypothetical protein
MLRGGTANESLRQRAGRRAFGESSAHSGQVSIQAVSAPNYFTDFEVGRQADLTYQF